MMESLTDLSQRSLTSTRQARHPQNNKFKKLRRAEVRLPPICTQRASMHDKTFCFAVARERMK